MTLYRKQYAYPEEGIVPEMKFYREPTASKPGVPLELKGEIGWWRKANAIHGWFVRNVQEGVDDCKEYDVSREQLERLLATVKEVIDASRLIPGKVRNGWTLEGGERKYIIEDGLKIANPAMAKALLPTQEGFFFGGCDYDQAYYEDLVYTQSVLEAAVEGPSNMGFSYRASW